MYLKQQQFHIHISFCRTRRSSDGQKLNVFPPTKQKAHSVQIWWTGTATHTCFANERNVHVCFVGYSRLDCIFSGPTATQKCASTKCSLSVCYWFHQQPFPKHWYLCHWKIVVKAVHTCNERSRPGVQLCVRAWYNSPCGVWLKIPSATACWPVCNTQRNTSNMQSHIPTVVHWSQTWWLLQLEILRKEINIKHKSLVMFRIYHTVVFWITAWHTWDVKNAVNLRNQNINGKVSHASVELHAKISETYGFPKSWVLGVKLPMPPSLQVTGFWTGQPLCVWLLGGQLRCRLMESG